MTGSPKMPSSVNRVVDFAPFSSTSNTAQIRRNAIAAQRALLRSDSEARVWGAATREAELEVDQRWAR